MNHPTFPSNIGNLQTVATALIHLLRWNVAGIGHGSEEMEICQFFHRIDPNLVNQYEVALATV